MKEFKGKVAVVTGGANGIGHALAQEAAKREMKVVIADIDKEGLDRVESEFKGLNADFMTVYMDVTEYSDMEMLAKKTIDKYGQVDILFNNAGVSVMGAIWELPINDIDYIIHSNLYSVAYGLRVFIPIMEKQNTDCHIVNTASVAGLITSPGAPTYFMTKHGNIGLSEAVNYQLQEKGSKIKMSVFCPGFVQTDLHNCDKRRPEKFKIDWEDPYYQSESYKEGYIKNTHVITTGIPIDSIGMSVFQAIEDEQFYILTHPQYLPIIGMRVKNVLDMKNPDVNFFK
ncbi:SDR family NAD(P)-dependent oxidoreductase [Sporanaerobacter acetigenes]|uniref:Short-chain dehydrogenase n=2 Tax=Sporanaerobacter acetigenes TaxID=165813 RepID=A0A1M5TA30_9FIRM|nr:SDR family NAD(P)-dependent oxidoreductase [Sporanaerobacter acetigenes]SHH47561.1 Short-chain dehydrogenase [Sporanaerobacter acetigenes DSM 13106]